jgi:peroxiredoxin Q/BCP
MNFWETSMAKVEDFEIASTDGTFRLSDQAGHPVVLYFYPKDNTPGCTSEGMQFRDLYPKFAKLGAVVAGVSRDSLKSHENFKSKMEFPFPLLSDADEALCTRFGVIKMKNMYGKKVRGIERSTFVIDKAGNLAREWRGVKVPGHAAEVLAFVKTL